MNKTKIEWTDYTWNPVTGCLHGCGYCYARKLYQRFHMSFEPTLHVERLSEPEGQADPAKIFVCSTGDLFGEWVSKDWIERVMGVIYKCPHHTFQTLTKNPDRLPDFNPWPANCWVGATATDQQSFDRAVDCLSRVRAKVRFISVEPFLRTIDPWLWRRNGQKFNEVVNWIIIGAQTNPNVAPKGEWLGGLLGPVKGSGIPVFIKDNLKKSLGVGAVMQEYPVCT